MEIVTSLSKAKVLNSCGRLILDAGFSGAKNAPVFCASFAAAALCTPGTEILVSDLPGRKYISHCLEFITGRAGLVYAGARQNRALFQEAFSAGRMEDFSCWKNCREIEADENLVYADFELTSAGSKNYVFLESVYDCRGGRAIFPSSGSFSEPALFEEIYRLRHSGASVSVFILVPCEGCSAAAFSWKHDPVAAARIFDAAKNGVNFVCYGCQVDKKSVSIANKLQIVY